MDPIVVAAFITAGSSIAVAILTGLIAKFSHQTRENTNHLTHELVEAQKALSRLAGLAEGKKIGHAQGVEDERAREENEQ